MPATWVDIAPQSVEQPELQEYRGVTLTKRDRPLPN